MSIRFRTLIALTALAGLLTAPACGQEDEPDQPALFESEEAGFRAEFPEEPERSSRSLTAGNVVLELIAFAAESEGQSVSVAYVDYPPEVNEGPPEDLLNSAADNAALSVAGTVESRSILDFRGYPAIDFTVVSDEGIIQARAFFVGDRFYLLQVVSTEAADGEDSGEVESNRFEQLVSSFQLV